MGLAEGEGWQERKVRCIEWQWPWREWCGFCSTGVGADQLHLARSAGCSAVLICAAMWRVVASILRMCQGGSLIMHAVHATGVCSLQCLLCASGGLYCTSAVFCSIAILCEVMCIIWRWDLHLYNTS
jgi:hypothetical protein